jgi:hypothetical protein
MATQATGWADGHTLVVRTRPRQAESRVGDRSTDRTRPEWSVAEDPEKLTGANREVTRGLWDGQAEHMVRWVDRRHVVVEAMAGRSSSSEERRTVRAEASCPFRFQGPFDTHRTTQKVSGFYQLSNPISD